MSAEEIVGFIRTNNQEAAERRLRTNEAKEKIEDFAKSLEKKDVEVITTGGEGILEVASNLSKLRDVIDRFGVDRLKGAKLYPAAGGVGSFKANNGVLHIELRENPEAIQKFLEENLPSVEQKV